MSYTVLLLDDAEHDLRNIHVLDQWQSLAYTSV